MAIKLLVGVDGRLNSSDNNLHQVVSKVNIFLPNHSAPGHNVRMKNIPYSEIAPYYDFIYSWKEYDEEVQALKVIIDSARRSTGKKLLDVACGTGEHLQYLKKHFSCEGLDLSPKMLSVARHKVKGVKFHQGDMMSFKLEKAFDVVLCLFSSIAYAKSTINLKRTIGNLANHVLPGGVMIIESWLDKASFSPGAPGMLTYEDDDLMLARLSVSKIKGKNAVLDMHYLIAERDKGVKHLHDRHEMGLFEKELVMQEMKKAGLETRYLKEGFMTNRGLFIGVKAK